MRALGSSLAIAAAARRQDFALDGRHAALSVYGAADPLRRPVALLLGPPRFAVLGYSPALLRIYEAHLAHRIEELTVKQLCLISWSYAKCNVYIQQLFERIGGLPAVAEQRATAAAYFYRDDRGSMTDASLLLWSFSKVERRVPHEIGLLRETVFGTLESIVSALRDPDAPLDDVSRRYLDQDRMFYSNVTHDLCMAAKALALLVPRDRDSVRRLVALVLEVARLGKMSLTAQGLTSLWESLCVSGVSDEHLVDPLCEASRYLRLDHSFNSNMLTAILSSVRALGVRDPRIVYQIVHWLEKRAVQMHPPQMYRAICDLDAMGFYHDKAWKQLGVVVQKKGIDLELGDIRRLYAIFKRNGRQSWLLVVHSEFRKGQRPHFRHTGALHELQGGHGARWVRGTVSLLLRLSDGDYLLVDHYGEKGVRRTMEDECVVHASLRSLNSDLPDAYNFTACGLFDGHGGRKTAEFARKYLFLEVAQELSQQLDAAGDDGSVFSEVVFKKSVNTACSRLDARIAKDLPDCHDGCTALLLFVSRNRVFVVNLGDSAAYLCRQLEGVIHAIPLSEVHKPWSPREKERILHYGGTVEGGRVNGLIEVSRSLGDLSMKRFGVKCTGTFRQAALDFSCDEFILMGCDGFWGVYDAQEACRTAMRFLRKLRKRQLQKPVADGVPDVLGKMPAVFHGHLRNELGRDDPFGGEFGYHPRHREPFQPELPEDVVEACLVVVVALAGELDLELLCELLEEEVLGDKVRSRTEEYEVGDVAID
ncbi:protein phosphatase 2C, putative [Babesia caballi]|uniref:protein-serine/threonine phosphatase n=1 Tax=Babesia caballi TaxID=5871 RepID=A0AAV4M1Y6_BABCB|nr:protein phosphatase 2C, putative [Babesia caballi]